MWAHEKLSAQTIDDLILALLELSKKGYGAEKWYGWDDTALIIEPENLPWLAVYPD